MKQLKRPIPMDPDNMSLQDLRDRIDAIDIQLQELIEQRTEVGREVGDFKRRKPEPKFVHLDREAQILKRVRQRNQGPIPDRAIERVFREIISIARSLEVDLTISILGPEGTFTHDAAIQHFGGEFEADFRPTIAEVFSAVEKDRAQYGVVPVENSNQGVVDSTLDCLMDSDLRLCGEIELFVHHNLVSSASDLSQIQSVLAHEQALAQCRKWLNRNLPNVHLENAYSNADAIVKIKDDPTKAAIASENAAKLYGINVLRTNIEDFVANATRFLIIGKDVVGPSGQDKTSILMSKQSVPGSLLKLLEPFARYGINMTKIESHPSQKGNWEYVFFVDFDGHCDDENVTALFNELQEEAPLFKLLGSYPKNAV